MFYLIEVEDYVRVAPEFFGMPTMEAVERQLENLYEDYYDKEIGEVVKVLEILEVGEGVIISGDGAAYYNSRFKLLVWKPELHELVHGEIAEITNFGAFINMGPMKGMIHISQTMDDYVSFSESESLLGKSSGRNLKKGDQCLARVVALSHKGDTPKIGLTMRQPGLGKLDWIEEDRNQKIKDEEKSSKEESKGKSKKKQGNKK